MTRVEVAPGFHLNVEIHGEGEPLVLLHGFTGSAKAWDGLIAALQGRYRIVAVDIVGHGESDSPGELDHYLMEQVTVDIVAALQSLGIGSADWLGYSMGGRTALCLAAAHPGLVNRLVLVGASPGLATQADRDARKAADDALADRIETEGIGSFIDQWESLPLFESQRSLPETQRTAIRKGRLANSATGLANSLRGMGTGVQPFVDVRTVTMPVLSLAGALDTKFCAIGREIAAAMPCARFEAIEGAGHAAHLERPEACAALIDHFLDIATPTGGHA